MENENSFRQDTLLTPINIHHMSWVSANITTVPQVYLKNGHLFFYFLFQYEKKVSHMTSCLSASSF